MHRRPINTEPQSMHTSLPPSIVSPPLCCMAASIYFLNDRASPPRTAPTFSWLQTEAKFILRASFADTAGKLVTVSWDHIALPASRLASPDSSSFQVVASYFYVLCPHYLCLVVVVSLTPHAGTPFDVINPIPGGIRSFSHAISESTFGRLQRCRVLPCSSCRSPPCEDRSTTLLRLLSLRN
jgi:hypothetical protein